MNVLQSLATDAVLIASIFTDMNFSELFETFTLGLLLYLVVRVTWLFLLHIFNFRQVYSDL